MKVLCDHARTERCRKMLEYTGNDCIHIKPHHERRECDFIYCYKSFKVKCIPYQEERK
jgi:hypothetical protein